MKSIKARILVGGFFIVMFMLVAQIAFASIVEIKDFSNFTAYPYNTSSYMSGGAYVGCGPTSGAMILDYFQNENANSNFLKNNSGLDTAWALHTTMNTNSAGDGSPYNIKSGMESYVNGLSPVTIGTQQTTYSLNVMYHVGSTYDASHIGASPSNPLGFNAYGAFGTAWTNDANFYYSTGSGSTESWHINADLFESWVATRLAAGTPIMVTVDSDGDKGGDHWIPLVGYNDVTNQYAYYNTWDSSLHWANIAYVTDEGSGWFGISGVRDFTLTSNTVTIGGGGTDVPEPATMLLLGLGLVGLAGARRKFNK